MAEAWHKKFKQVILKVFPVNNFEELVQKLPEMIEYANNLYLPVLGTLSSNEVLSGKTVTDLNISEKMETARKKRIEENRAFNCKVRCKRS